MAVGEGQQTRLIVIPSATDIAEDIAGIEMKINCHSFCISRA